MKTLGEGAYAKVKLAESKKHNCQVAVKVINKRRAPKDFLKKFLPREVHLMHRLSHPNVIKLYEVVETSTKVFLILQLASKACRCHGFLSQGTRGTQGPEMRKHFDGGDGKLKVTDFGFAISTIKNRLLETFCGSYAYCCPQILRGEPYDGKKADVWSMAWLLYAMACARLPFSEDDMRALVKEDFTNKIKFSKRVSKECRDLVRWMLNADQNQRASAEQVFRSPWCMKALKDNPELCYLEEHLNPMPVRKPSECAPQETDEFGKHKRKSTLLTLNQYHAKIGERPRMVTCFTFAAPAYIAKQQNQGRRHTISGFEIHDKSYRMSLRDDLLRSSSSKGNEVKVISEN
ncbi:hypothetical protein OS493_037580 [Desmophyllum pertusum]|uniref:Protein kinase domain-containing protein n=1 Tax=Desmophyllum pertusum TaxID=174260 RepID=A0A9W9YHU4_9CNID|nr:hypothetical protein OS493_037580 [Desmophyllum pertusum]